jgi:hypothetical protein
MLNSKLKNWCMFRRYSRTHGEMRNYLTGDVYGCPGRRDGTRIVTSALVSCDGKVALTSSGDSYQLGEPDGGEKSDDFADDTRTRGFDDDVSARPRG